MDLGSRPLEHADIRRIVVEGERVSLSDEARVRIQRSANFVRAQAESGQAVYGVTTGFGANRDTVIDLEDAGTLQERLIMSHACGVGAPLPSSVVRTMMLLRAASLVQGNSGIQVETLELLVEMINRGIVPVVPEFGSVGASGDLCPLAHMCLPVIGLGQVEVDGEIVPGEQGLRMKGLAPRSLTYKEGLALLNGTQAMTALGLVVTAIFETLLDSVDVLGAMSLEAVAGRLAALDPRIHEVRGRAGQMKSASNVRRLLAGSELAGAPPGSIEGKQDYVQDSYCLRCMPQVHGACRDVLDYVKGVLMTEANAVTDNPLVFVNDDGTGDILSGGNFHGEPVAMALDYLKLAVAELGNISERRCAKLTDKHFSEGLPAFLVKNPGLNSGYMIPQYVAAALVSENKTNAFPASVDSIPTSANMEDHVSMGMHAGLHAYRMLENTTQVLGIEYLIAGQALDLRQPVKLGVGTERAWKLLRELVPPLEEDRVMDGDMAAASALVRDGALRSVVIDLLG